MDSLAELQRKFINLRLGTLIHFNSATFQFHSGDILDWEFDCENGSSARRYPFSPAEWAPDSIDCRQWAAVSRSAGCRFAALTAKHHEGFALWPTKWSEHCVRNAAVKTDVVAEYLREFRAAGIAAGLYFSILDLTAGIGRGSCGAYQKEYIKGQISELLTNYGDIPFLIVDGWAAPWGGPDYGLLPFEELDGLVKSLQPECLLLNIGCTSGLSGSDLVFFENAAGQTAGSSFRGPGVLCNKLTASWFWRDQDCIGGPLDIRWICAGMSECFPMNCAFMLNLSPDIHGRINGRLADAFDRIGKSVELPAPLEALPAGWMRRETQYGKI